jgi:hypothetical protein
VPGRFLPLCALAAIVLRIANLKFEDGSRPVLELTALLRRRQERRSKHSAMEVRLKPLDASLASFH